jgi:predicted transcriptional regulator
MSIHEEWATAILRRTKRWEFRRRCGLESGMRVWLYATAPRAEIVGYFTIGEIRRVNAAHPDPRVAKAGFLTVPDLRVYLKGLEDGYAIEPTKLRRLSRPVRLSAGQRGPQSYRFLYSDTDRSLLARLAKAAGP